MQESNTTSPSRKPKQKLSFDQLLIHEQDTIFEQQFTLVYPPSTPDQESPPCTRTKREHEQEKFSFLFLFSVLKKICIFGY